jgi:hypothetical protein
MPFERRIATLVAFARIIEATATDDAIDVLELLIKDLLTSSARDGKKQRLRTLKDLDAAALQLSEACGIMALTQGVSSGQFSFEDGTRLLHPGKRLRSLFHHSRFCPVGTQRH